jgi:hypothetical protein
LHFEPTTGFKGTFHIWESPLVGGKNQ